MKVNFEEQIQKVQSNIKELKSLKKAKRINPEVADSIIKYGESIIDLFESKIKK